MADLRAQPWRLHPALAADCHRLASLGTAELLLHRNATLHWCILVPRVSVLDLLDLEPAPREALLTEAARVAAYLKRELGYPRVNIAALGLLVPQLHLHVIGRRESDPCWPGPVWGNLPPGPRYAPQQIEALVSALGAAAP